MADIFRFQGDEYCDCEACQVTEEYLHVAKNCKTIEELRAILRGLYEDAYDNGYEGMLRDDIEAKQELLERGYDDEEYDL